MNWFRRAGLAGLYRLTRWLETEESELLLEMVFPETDKLVEVPELASGYRFRFYREEDHEAYQRLMAAADMGECPMGYWRQHWLPDGFFVIEEVSTGELVAACFASHHPSERHPMAGNFGWLAVDPGHGGKGLGFAISAAVTARLQSGGYKRIYLETHDHRLSALSIYLKLGWLPLIYHPELEARWRGVFNALGLDFDPSDWVWK